VRGFAIQYPVGRMHNVQPAINGRSCYCSAGLPTWGGDTVNIAVHGQPDMTMRFILDKSGEINFPFVGALKLQDKTVDQVTKELTQRLTGDYFTTPMVTVSIAEFRKYYVSGEVKSPNGFAYEPGLTVEKSIAQAGGFTDRADRQRYQHSPVR
jgi:polysaccharide export outer membrane protein